MRITLERTPGNCLWYDTLVHPEDADIASLRLLLHDLQYVEKSLEDFIKEHQTNKNN